MLGLIDRLLGFVLRKTCEQGVDVNVLFSA